MISEPSHSTRAVLAAAALTVLLVGCGAPAVRSGQGRAQLRGLAATRNSSTTTSTSSTTTTTSPPTTTTTTQATTTTTQPTTTTTQATTTTTQATTTTTAPPCPANLADSLSDTYGADQLITAESPDALTSYATVELWQRSGNCWVSAGGPWPARIGANGFSSHHVEGDNTTPIGIYGIGSTMYGNQPNPGVRYAYHQLVCGDWWDEDPSSPEYNTFQHVPCGSTPPFGGDSEALWTETAPYPSFAVIDYNTAPIVPGAGSGIFFHADTGSATAGCVAIPLSDLDLALDWLNPALQPLFAMGPSDVITGL